MITSIGEWLFPKGKGGALTRERGLDAEQTQTTDVRKNERHSCLRTQHWGWTWQLCHHLGYPYPILGCLVKVLASPLPIQLPANKCSLLEAANDGSSTWISAIHVLNSDSVLGFWVWPGQGEHLGSEPANGRTIPFISLSFKWNKNKLYKRERARHCSKGRQERFLSLVYSQSSKWYFGATSGWEVMLRFYSRRPGYRIAFCFHLNHESMSEHVQLMLILGEKLRNSLIIYITLWAEDPETASDLSHRSSCRAKSRTWLPDLSNCPEPAA